MIDSLAKRYGIGCGDASCAWGSRGGMSTNGGCRCSDLLQATEEHRQEARRIRKGIHALRRALSADPDIGAALDQLVLAIRVQEAGLNTSRAREVLGQPQDKEEGRTT